MIRKDKLTVSPRIILNSLMFQSGKWDSFRIVTCWMRKMRKMRNMTKMTMVRMMIAIWTMLQPECLHSRQAQCHKANSGRTSLALSRCT